MTRTLAALTLSGSTYPPYLSINMLDDGVTVEITVRSESTLSKIAKNMTVIGSEGVIRMPLASFLDVLKQLAGNFGNLGLAK